MAMKVLRQTPGLIDVLARARAEASRMGHDFIGPEHLFVAILRKGEGLAIQLLLNMEADIDELVENTERQAQNGKAGTIATNQTLDAEAKKVIETAAEVSEQIGNNWLGTEHVLIALARVEGTLPKRVLEAAKLDYERIRLEAAYFAMPSSRVR